MKQSPKKQTEGAVQQKTAGQMLFLCSRAHFLLWKPTSGPHLTWKAGFFPICSWWLQGFPANQCFVFPFNSTKILLELPLSQCLNCFINETKNPNGNLISPGNNKSNPSICPCFAVPVLATLLMVAMVCLDLHLR